MSQKSVGSWRDEDRQSGRHTKDGGLRFNARYVPHDTRNDSAFPEAVLVLLVGDTVECPATIVLGGCCPHHRVGRVLSMSAVSSRGFAHLKLLKTEDGLNWRQGSPCSCYPSLLCLLSSCGLCGNSWVDIAFESIRRKVVLNGAGWVKRVVKRSA